MLTDKDKQTIIRKKKSELLSLGIDPNIYYHISKFFNKSFMFIYKNYEVIVFRDDEKIFEEDLLEEINIVFNITGPVASLILDEWVRDRIIYHNMMDNQKKYFDYLSLPLPYNDNDHEGFNF